MPKATNIDDMFAYNRPQNQSVTASEKYLELFNHNIDEFLHSFIIDYICSHHGLNHRPEEVRLDQTICQTPLKELRPPRLFVMSQSIFNPVIKHSPYPQVLLGSLTSLSPCSRTLRFSQGNPCLT